MAKETNYRWHFDLQGGAEQGPNVPTQKSFAGDKYVTLVREAIQNSLDAPLDTTKPVRVEMKVTSVQRNNLPSFFGIENHIKSCLSYWSKNPDAEITFKPMLDYLGGIGNYDKLHYIEVADYNTTGMYYEKGNNTTPFFSFLMSVGNSSKNDQKAGGSFGFGKAAYFNVSKIASLLVSTRTARGQSFFEGVSSLCTHEMDGTKYTSFGYFDNNGGEPVCLEEDIPERFKRSEPGTTFCIMGVEAKEEKEKQKIYKVMRLAVLRNFWLSIYERKLEVKVGDEEITHDNVRELVEQNFPDEEDSGRRSTTYSPRPYLRAVADADTDRHCRIIEKNIDQLGHVKLYALRQNGAKGKLLFMREPRMLVYYERTKGFYGVFVCDDLGGNRILRRMENMRHDEWDPKNCPEDSLLREQGRIAKEALDTFIKECIEALFPTKKDNLREIQDLKEYLYIPTAAEADDDFDTESLVGEAIDVKDDAGSSPTTVVKDKGEANPPEKKHTTGQVLVDAAPAPHRPDPNGEHHGGHGKGKKGSGGGTTRTNTSSNYTPDPNGIGGSTKTHVPISYRSFAFSHLGKTRHRLVIRCEENVPNAELKIFVAGEQSKEELTIAWSSEGTIGENSVKGVALVAQQKKIIDLQFVDDMKYALIVTAYEN